MPDDHQTQQNLARAQAPSLLAVLARAAEETAAVQTLAELRAALRNAAEALGCQSFNLALDKPTPRSVMQESLLSTWTQGALREYEQLDLYDRDPLLRHAVSTQPTWLWRTPDLHRLGEYEFHEFVGAAGVRWGVTVPMNRADGTRSMLALVSRGAMPFPAAEMRQAAQVLAGLLSSRAVGLSAGRRPALDHALRLKRLSPRQIEILDWLSRGKTNAEIALITDMSRRTVDYHVAEIIHKLDVVNRTQAAAVFMSR
ncbi:LuxR family transcriptional regulator [Paracoccus aminovorans]|uniref:LuxR family transcriptional regulator n=1 Tax=Paracoccus aminovorans TaxID=34004 RepID=A0A1I3CFP6_9RHOB|nr:LuxR family transcriptional regulator [Paracoccus aminovorans]SFH72891.1 LuxR family transcriptional regulator [Paracoccus aminovorans]